MFRILITIFLAFMLSPAWSASADTSLISGEFSPPRMAPDFSLRGSNGSELKLSRYRGKVVALGFGFTSCPEICPTTLAELAAAKRKLGDDGKGFQVIYITVDPERDTIERLKTYVTEFDPSFIGATGTQAQLAEVRKAYGITAVRKNVGNGGDYGFDHSAFIYLIDPQGRIRALSPYGRKVDDVVHDVRILLKK